MFQSDGFLQFPPLCSRAEWLDLIYFPFCYFSTRLNLLKKACLTFFVVVTGQYSILRARDRLKALFWLGLNFKNDGREFLLANASLRKYYLSNPTFLKVMKQDHKKYVSMAVGAAWQTQQLLADTILSFSALFQCLLWLGNKDMHMFTHCSVTVPCSAEEKEIEKVQLIVKTLLFSCKQIVLHRENRIWLVVQAFIFRKFISKWRIYFWDRKWEKSTFD